MTDMRAMEQLTETVTLHCGDCLDVLKTLDADSVDSCVTDPPYHLTSIVKRFANAKAENERYAIEKSHTAYMSRGFMGKTWDGGDIAFRPDVWREVYRVLKPGAHLLAFGGDRTFHRLACAVEDAGFEIRGTIAWVFGQGFPKNLNVSARLKDALPADARYANLSRCPNCGKYKIPEGLGTSLKPAMELIVLARKPLSEDTVAGNVLRWGTGALNIDSTRVPSGTEHMRGLVKGSNGGALAEMRGQHDFTATDSPLGRWPANVIHDGSEEVVALFPETSPSPTGMITQGGDHFSIGSNEKTCGTQFQGHGDSGSAARFFFQVQSDVRCELCSANIATSASPTESILTDVSVRSNAAALQVPASADSEPLSSNLANNAGSHSSQCHLPSDSFAPSNVEQWPLSKIAQNVKSAATLCNSCATNIARALAALRTRRRGESVQYRDFITGRNAPILIHHLALYVAGRENTDIILTIPSLKQLFGSVSNAIGKFTPEVPTTGDTTGKLKRVFYASKADFDDRLGSFHPTVKPLDLMQYLVRLVTPPGGLVLDCFAGTGTTGEAAWREGMRAVLIEREAEYQDDIRRRMRLLLASARERRHESVKTKQKDRPPDHGPLFGGAAERA